MTVTRPDVWAGIRIRGPWSIETVRQHLEEGRIPLRLALVARRRPWAVSLWFLPEPDGLWIATQPDSFVARTLQTDPACGFELARDEPPYRGVRGTARAEARPAEGGSVLERLMERYGVRPDSQLARFLLARASRELAFRIVPLRASTWDFRERMADALAPDGNGPSRSEPGR